MHSDNSGGNGQNITAGTNTMAAAMLPLITAGANTDRVCWHLHHRWMVRRSDVDVLNITAEWHSGLALMRSHHHSQMVCRTSIDRSMVTAGWYAIPAMIGALSPLNGMPG